MGSPPRSRASWCSCVARRAGWRWRTRFSAARPRTSLRSSTQKDDAARRGPGCRGHPGPVDVRRARVLAAGVLQVARPAGVGDSSGDRLWAGFGDASRSPSSRRTKTSGAISSHRPSPVHRSWSIQTWRAGLSPGGDPGAAGTFVEIVISVRTSPSPARRMVVLGHSQIGLTMNTYAHVTLGLGRSAAERMDEVIGQRRADAVAS